MPKGVYAKDQGRQRLALEQARKARHKRYAAGALIAAMSVMPKVRSW